MGKRRHSAKTGDKKLYARRSEHSSSSAGKPVQDSIEDFLKEKDESYLALNSKESDGESAAENFTTKHDILDLGVRGESSEDEEDETDIEDIPNGGSSKFTSRYSVVPFETGTDDDDESDMGPDTEELDQVDPRSWGRKKSSYYDADTGDLEIGQDEEDAFVEEEAARQVQASRFGEMDQNDFALPDGDGEGEKPTSLPKTTNYTTERDMTQLAPKRRRKFLQLQHPELIPVASHFAEVLTEFVSSTNIAIGALFENEGAAESVGATKQGQMFLLTKAMIEQSIALNTTIYLLVKSFIAQDIEGSQDIDAHPVMHQLKAASLLEEKLVENVVGKTENLQEQMKNLVKAATLLIDHAGIIPDIRIQDSGTSFQGERKEPDIQPKIVDTSSSANFSGQIYESRSCDAVANEVRFGLRHHEIGGKRKTERRRVATFSDFGDGNEDDTIPRSLAATINTIDQRAASDYGKGKARHSTEETDYFEEKVEVTAGIRIMEDELEGIHGKDFSDESNGAANNLISNESEENDSNWYNKIAEKATMKKQIKEQMHRVAPKFPRLEAEVSGERAITTTILKNRGLVAHKAKINRNPRVKKRLQYRKALIKRKGAVREVRTDEGHKYDGEETGIKSRITRSRKLTS